MVFKDHIQIDYLKNYPQWIPILADWFYDEWRPLYVGKFIEDVAEAIRERLNDDKIPLALVALQGEKLIGTVCLKNHDMDTREDLSPWLAGLYVAVPYRGNGIGKTLVDAIVDEAKKLMVSHLYLYTPTAETFFSKLGWSALDRTTYKGVPVVIMQRQLLV